MVAGGSPTISALSIAFSLGSLLLSQDSLPYQLRMHDNVVFLLTRSSFLVLCLLGLSAVYKEWQRSGLAAQGKERAAELAALVQQLPMETWLCHESRQKASVCELRRRLDRRRVPLLGIREKVELVEALEGTPHDTLCSICYVRTTARADPSSRLHALRPRAKASGCLVAQSGAHPTAAAAATGGLCRWRRSTPPTLLTLLSCRVRAPRPASRTSPRPVLLRLQPEAPSHCMDPFTPR